MVNLFFFKAMFEYGCAIILVRGLETLILHLIY